MKNEITVDVKVNMHVDTEIANRALNIIDIWLGEDPERQIEAQQFDDGSWVMNLVPGREERHKMA